MTIERPENFEDRIRREASESASLQVNTAGRISREAEIAETFDLTDSQMSVFNSAFGYVFRNER